MEWILLYLICSHTMVPDGAMPLNGYELLPMEQPLATGFPMAVTLATLTGTEIYRARS